ncbi:hypothetical protein GPECTOR_19g299 [Gonium pectorale]|uniref:Uncharacterized protein n=1 Tax=Gonium pectorale TaxID=33097 RepID=A0A150GJ66_GONPE|nr:hypothetical protein GPECTOR_19g299 [Gonium pectorale]|eukprot:KXZ49848.1 hypothetical protein GPECTOR_19g299 [Gonium pectorale]
MLLLPTAFTLSDDSQLGNWRRVGSGQRVTLKAGLLNSSGSSAWHIDADPGAVVRIRGGVLAPGVRLLVRLAAGAHLHLVNCLRRESIPKVCCTGAGTVTVSLDAGELMPEERAAWAAGVPALVAALLPPPPAPLLWEELASLCVEVRGCGGGGSGGGSGGGGHTQLALRSPWVLGVGATADGGVRRSLSLHGLSLRLAGGRHGWLGGIKIVAIGPERDDEGDDASASLELHGISMQAGVGPGLQPAGSGGARAHCHECSWAAGSLAPANASWPL